MVNVLTELAELTPSRLTDLLRRNGYLHHAEVAGIQAEASRRTNHSVVYHLAVQYAGDEQQAPTRLFLKLLEPDLVWAHKEVEFYRELVSHMSRSRFSANWLFPHCYEAAFSPETGRSHLILEELSATHFTNSAMIPPTRRLCEMLIDAYAQFHAFWWQHPYLGFKVGIYLTDADVDRFEADCQHQLEQLTETYERDLSESQFRLLCRAVAKWPKRRRAQVVQGKQLTVVHRDPHPHNMLYPRDPDAHPIKLIDWQSWRVDPATDDLAYLIAFHWPPDARAYLEKKLLDRYYHQLAALGVQHYTRDDFLFDYRASIVRFLGIMTMHWQHPANRQRVKLGLQAFVDWKCEQILY